MANGSRIFKASQPVRAGRRRPKGRARGVNLFLSASASRHGGDKSATRSRRPIQGWASKAARSAAKSRSIGQPKPGKLLNLRSQSLCLGKFARKGRPTTDWLGPVVYAERFGRGDLFWRRF